LAKHRVSAEFFVRIGEAAETIVNFARHIEPDTDHGRSVTGHPPRSSEPLELSNDLPAQGFSIIERPRNGILSSTKQL
jgi:hypothetical protein